MRIKHTLWLDFAMMCLQLGTESREQLETKEAELQVWPICILHAC